MLWRWSHHNENGYDLVRSDNLLDACSCFCSVSLGHTPLSKPYPLPNLNNLSIELATSNGQISSKTTPNGTCMGNFYIISLALCIRFGLSIDQACLSRVLPSLYNILVYKLIRQLTLWESKLITIIIQIILHY